MIRMIFYFILLGLLMALGLWVANQPGHFRLILGNEIIETTPGLFFVFLFVAVAVISLAWQCLRWLVQLPISLRRASLIRRYKMAFAAVAEIVVRLSTGEITSPQKIGRRLRDKFPDPALGNWMQALVAQASGDKDLAKVGYLAMVASPSAAPLGLYYLARQALKAKDYKDAEDHLGRLASYLPDAPWLLLTKAKLRLRENNPKAALIALSQCSPKLPKDKALKARLQAVANFLEALSVPTSDKSLRQQFLSYAVEYDPGFTPAVLAYAAMLSTAHKEIGCHKLLEKAWMVAPVFAVGQKYVALTPPSKPIDRFKEAQALVGLQPSAPGGYLLVIKQAIDAQLWGEAKSYLTKAQRKNIFPDHGLLPSLLQRCLEDTKSDLVRTTWPMLDDVVSAINWQCAECHHTQGDWSFECPACGALQSMAIYDAMGAC